MRLAKGLALLKLTREELASRRQIREEKAFGQRVFGGSEIIERVEQFDIAAFQEETKIIRKKLLELEAAINETNWNVDLPGGWWDNE